jgi:predicted phage terminase large subunit-like protein
MKKFSRKEQEKLLTLKREERIRLSRKSFWEFCKTKAPDFYTEDPDRKYLKDYCNLLQALYEKRIIRYNTEEDWKIVESLDGLSKHLTCRKLIINMWPQSGKSRTLVLFCQWVFGQNRSERIITCSYNDDLASDFSRYTRDGIAEEKERPHEIVYSDIFSKIKLKDGNASFEKWALEGEFFSYKGAGVGGSITGKGGTIRIVDDPIKDAETAYNETALDKIWRWFTGTFLSRGAGLPIDIINMTRWSELDPCGRIIKGLRARDWYIWKLNPIDKNGNMTCESLLPRERLEELEDTMDPAIYRANYFQEPVSVKGRLYQEFKEYKDIPRDHNGTSLIEETISYTDTADEGTDWLCSFIADLYQGEGYIKDVYFTQEPMEITEPEEADILVRNEVDTALIESNNGGRGFARNVERQIWERHQTRRVNVLWFHQSANKQARILTNANFIMKHIYFPEGWRERWPKLYQALASYQKEGKNKFDDAPDALTGLAEMIADGIASGEPEVETYQTEVSISPV